MLALRRFQPTLLAARGVRLSHQGHHNPHGHSGDPKEIEHEKQKSLKGESESPVEGAPGWNDKLASTAEAEIKAKKDPRGPEELQKDTAASHEAEQKKN